MIQIKDEKNDFKDKTEKFFDNYHNQNKILSNLTELDKFLMEKYYLSISGFLLDEIKHHKIISENSKILDIGCGSGEYLIFLKNYLKMGKYYGTDISQLAIEQAAENTKKNKFEFFGDPYLFGFNYQVNPNDFSFCKTNGKIFEFEDNYFDIVYFIMLLHHTYEYKNIIKEAYRVLKNDGILIIVDLKGQTKLVKILIKSVFKIIPEFFKQKIFKNDLILENGKIPFRSDVSLNKINRIVNEIDGFRTIKTQTHYIVASYFILFLNLVYSKLLFRVLKPFLCLIISIDQRLANIFKNNCNCYAIIIKKSK